MAIPKGFIPGKDVIEFLTEGQTAFNLLNVSSTVFMTEDTISSDTGKIEFVNTAITTDTGVTSPQLSITDGQDSLFISGNTIQNTVDGSDLNYSVTGAGVHSFNNSILPDVDSSYSIGNAAKVWNSVFANQVTDGAGEIGFQLNGSDNTGVDSPDKDVIIGSGIGVWLKSNNYWDGVSDRFRTDGFKAVQVAVKGSQGNNLQLRFSTNTPVADGNIVWGNWQDIFYGDIPLIPSSTSLYDIGSSDNKYRDGHFSGTMTVGNLSAYTGGIEFPSLYENDCNIDGSAWQKIRCDTTALNRPADWSMVFNLGEQGSRNMQIAHSFTSEQNLFWLRSRHDGGSYGPWMRAFVDAMDLIPSSNNTYNLGSVTKKYKDGYFSGDMQVGSLDARSSNTIADNNWITGAFGNGANDCVVFGTLDESPTGNTGNLKKGVVGAHNNSLSAWTDLLLNFQPGDSSGGNVYTRNHYAASDSTYDIGSIIGRFKDGYFSGTLKSSSMAINKGSLSDDSGLSAMTLLNNSNNGFYIFDNGRIEITSRTGQDVVFDANSKVVRPITDNDHDLGTTDKRFNDIYATNGTIQTSDIRQKTDIENSKLGLQFISSLNPISFVRKDGKRRHYGLSAQDVENVLAGEDFAGLIYDKDADMYGLRYEEFIAPLIKSVQELYVKLVVSTAISITALAGAILGGLYLW